MSNKNSASQRSRLSRQILAKYFLSVIGFIVAFVAIVLILWRVSATITWYEDDLLYRSLIYVREYILLFGGIPLILGIVLITYYFISRPLRYLDQVVEASEQLMTSGDEPVKLPADLKTVQDEMNLLREQNIRSRRAAREAEQRKNDLIVYLAHDLKTPLTGVTGYLSLLRDEPDISDTTRSKYLNIALEKAQRLEDLINEFFEITRFNLSSISLELERTNLTRMLEQITYEFSPVLSEKNLMIDTQLEPDTEITFDRDKLERVFDNLIRNAINYSYPDSTICFFMEHTDLPAPGALITVKNHGKTIPADKLERIFEQFFRLDPARSASTGGSGLGLAIAKEIVETHGGRISASSRDETITFTVFLPEKPPQPESSA